MKGWQPGERDSTVWIWSFTWISVRICLQATRGKVQSPSRWVILVDEARICPRSVVLKYESRPESPEGMWKQPFWFHGSWGRYQKIYFSKKVLGDSAASRLGTVLENHWPRVISGVGNEICMSDRMLQWQNSLWDISRYPWVNDLSQITKLAESGWVFLGISVQRQPSEFPVGRWLTLTHHKQRSRNKKDNFQCLDY